MTDHVANGAPASRNRSTGFEYKAYFAVIFLISLPWAFVSWALGLARPEGEDAGRGFIGRAWHQATVITPQIFSA